MTSGLVAGTVGKARSRLGQGIVVRTIVLVIDSHLSCVLMDN